MSKMSGQGVVIIKKRWVTIILFLELIMKILMKLDLEVIFIRI